MPSPWRRWQTLPLLLVPDDLDRPESARRHPRPRGRYFDPAVELEEVTARRAGRPRRPDARPPPGTASAVHRCPARSRARCAATPPATRHRRRRSLTAARRACRLRGQHHMHASSRSIRSSVPCAARRVTAAPQRSGDGSRARAPRSMTPCGRASVTSDARRPRSSRRIRMRVRWCFTPCSVRDPPTPYRVTCTSWRSRPQQGQPVRTRRRVVAHHVGAASWSGVPPGRASTSWSS